MSIDRRTSKRLRGAQRAGGPVSLSVFLALRVCVRVHVGRASGRVWPGRGGGRVRQGGKTRAVSQGAGGRVSLKVDGCAVGRWVQRLRKRVRTEELLPHSLNGTTQGYEDVERNSTLTHVTSVVPQKNVGKASVLLMRLPSSSSRHFNARAWMVIPSQSDGSK